MTPTILPTTAPAIVPPFDFLLLDVDAVVGAVVGDLVGEAEVDEGVLLLVLAVKGSTPDVVSGIDFSDSC